MLIGCVALLREIHDADMLAAAVTWNDRFICPVASDLPRPAGMFSSYRRDSAWPPLPRLGAVPG